MYGLRKGIDVKLLTSQDLDQKTGDIKPSFYTKKDNNTLKFHVDLNLYVCLFCNYTN